MDRYQKLVLDTVQRLGDIIMKDDRKDIGKFDRVHHWFIGACMKYGVDVARSLAILGDVGKALVEMSRRK